MAGPYKLTLYTALPGTALLGDDGKPTGETSAAGHMWYDISDGSGHVNSYGFALKEHGAMSGPGKGYPTDTASYQSPRYTRTLEITAEQYAKLKQFGEAAIDENWRYFKGDYNGLTNSCVDFTWGALKHAGLEIHRPEIRSRDGKVVLSPEYKGVIEKRFDGRMAPEHNKVDMEQIVPPVSDSPHNRWRENPPPSKATLIQKIISDNGESAMATQVAHFQRFKDQLGPQLKSLGMSEQQIERLTAAAAKEATRHADQGEVSEFLLKKDGSGIAMRQEDEPLREFNVAEALGKSAQAHWQEASAMGTEQKNIGGDGVAVAQSTPSEHGARMT